MELNFSKLEKKVLRFWKEYQIFEKSIAKRKKEKNFVFYEGPPTANARPGIHHVLSRVFKDIICRFKTMQGFRVERKAGWDTHGLPVELEIEKKKGFKTKKDIENFGIAKFNKECKKSVWRYKKDWEKLTKRIGFWLDLKSPYITYERKYIESLWFILKKIWEKGLLYQDFKVSPYCPRCQTVLSSHELAQGYKKIKEKAIFVKFKILNPEFKNTSLLIWTTTPWTLPGNVAVALNSKFEYVKIKRGKEFLILAKERIGKINLSGEIIKEFQGKELVGLNYQPPFDFYHPNLKKEKIWETINADFVSLEEGTGLVHIAPAFGEEDMELIKNTNLKLKIQKQLEFPILINVDEEGKFKLEVKKWAGMFVKEADPLIIEELKNDGLLLKEELYEHDYPFCWRCKTPLLYYAKEGWFIRMKKIKDELIDNNQKINWIPGHIKEGRFGEWLKDLKDWAISRNRYWGTPLPVWKCKKCNRVEVIGSLKDLLKQKFSTNKYFILRHGETIYQKEKKEIIYPQEENFSLGLTEEGKKKVKMVAQKIKKEKIDFIYSSDFFRTKETAEIIAKELNLKINFSRELRDVNLGIYHGFSKEKYYQEFPICQERFEKRPEKGESWLDCQKRMIKFLKKIDRKHYNKNILIISHGDPLWLLEGIMKGKDRKELIEEKKRGKIIKPAEMKKLDFKILPLTEKMEVDFHRPYVDQVKFYCPTCSDFMERVPEVIDCWFDSGAMPFGQVYWPFFPNSPSKPPKLFPADYICEGIDQTRGWFYTLLAISTLLGFGAPYKNVISLGLVLDEKGEKMSKSKGNVVNPWEIIEKYGADALRWYFYTINQPAESKNFSEKEIEESLRKVIFNFMNCYRFFEIYSKEKFPELKINKKFLSRASILDKWILSKINNLIFSVENKLNSYDITGAGRMIENFLINDFSLWYIRRSRKKFQMPENKEEFKNTSCFFAFLLLNISKVLAPFIPFLAEEIYRKISNNKISVHLENWPKFNEKMINKDLEKKMENTRKITALALAERKKENIKVRQPLNLLKVKNPLSEDKNENEELFDLIKEEVNVKRIVIDSTIEKEIFLDKEITAELKKEGIVREIIRHLQEMRKTLGFKPKDKILLKYSSEGEIGRILEENKERICRETRIKEMREIKEKENFIIKKEIKVDNQKLILAIKKFNSL